MSKLQSVEARRGLFRLAALGALFASAAPAQAAAPKRSMEDQERADRQDVGELIQRERAARDAGRWDVMAASYHPDSRIEVSWFQGSGPEFVDASRRNYERGRFSLHQMSPGVVDVNADRALADVGCQLTGFSEMEGVEVCVTSYARLLWRAQRADGRWLISGLRMIYLRDLLLPVDPTRPPKLDEQALARYRRSYRYLSATMASSAHPASDQLPGVDRPDLVEALRKGEAAWLAGA